MISGFAGARNTKKPIAPHIFVLHDLLMEHMTTTSSTSGSVICLHRTHIYRNITPLNPLCTLVYGWHSLLVYREARHE